MLYFVLGSPGGFAEWCDRLTAELVRRAVGPTEMVAADQLAEITLSAIATGATRAAIATRQPGGRLYRALIESGRRFVVALDDPRLALAELAAGRGTPLAAAIQAVASSCATLLDHPDAAGALVLRREFDPPRTAVAALIARHLEFDLPEVEIAAAAEQAASGQRDFSWREAGEWWNRLAPQEQALATGALAAFLDNPAPTASLSLSWAGALFFRGDRPDQRATEPIDITGRAHCLIDGPHIMLPRGEWSMSVNATLSGSATEHEFAVEVLSEQLLASGTLRPEPAGGAVLDLQFAVDDAVERPIALRISTLRAAFDGAVALDEVRLVRSCR